MCMVMWIPVCAICCMCLQTADGKKAWGKTPYRKLYGTYGWCNVSAGVVPIAT